MKKTWMWLVMLAAIELTGCTSHFEPFVGITSGKNRTYAAPVESYGYNYEDMDGGSIGGGCIPGTPGVEIYEVGKKRFGGGATCGAAALKAKWTPGMTMKINWKVIPYPDWRPKALNTSGMNFDHNQLNIIDKYDEYYSTEIPLPPPPPSAGDDFGKVANITVHFLACNQLFITYGTIEEGRNTPMHYKLFAESQKLCTPRPVVKSMADYRRNKARMDAVKAERKNIPQVILPRYIKQLEAEGKLPVTTSK
ncbi:hypothetical protein SALWKB2_0906 [Snodgrassella alvi wkB2]|uniref:DUF3304 domain-containing protein n=1 Tax=Snodgrassella alvi TaxID=1196083 RepID=A0ABD7YZ34_9NEIS|nr:DUF3304 domain-containing protein [Snodgrassella alvi]AHN28288.1 hypothetical protein SALWKB2_0906 [Snodgrassella alvi wkB2]PIT46607.1 hypothetical protein BHC45_01950 [Snodgrassella alvi]UOO98595.1 DUF3304 domain-containing protein [Snodgrassella alvi wkB2]WLS97438.1 DUF3304 domain-containing protein [Snodgrassella alvi]